MRIAITSLSSCLGCQLVFLSLEDFLLAMIGENSVLYAPLLVDAKELPEADLILVEGAVRNGDDYRRAREARERAGNLVALGTCACYGGVQGMANMVSEQRLMRGRFGAEARFEGEPPGTGRLLPLDACVKVDAYLPGCPPPLGLLRSFLDLALSADSPSRRASSVCAECAVSGASLPQPGPRRTVEAAGEAGKCLLEQGFLCMGPLTRDGCGALCVNELGIPCHGCRGPSDAVLAGGAADPCAETLRRLARATGRKRGDLREEVADPAHTFYKFCLAEPLLRRRRPGGTAPFLHRLGRKG